MLSNLLGFMHAYNLRFGVADSPEQRTAYSKLFEILDESRDRILAEAKIGQGESPRVPASRAEDFYQKLEQGRPKGGASARP
jgi:hypothetical protein